MIFHTFKMQIKRKKLLTTTFLQLLGVDYTHPALGGCYGPGCRVAYGYNFIDNNDDPYDNCHGHGTAVSAIIGGKDDGPGFVGVAPDVTFGAYRIYSCS